MVKASARTVHHAFAKYLDLAHDGQRIIITKRGKPWATLEPLSDQPGKKKKVDWMPVFERTHKLFKGRQVDAVKTLLELRDEERW